MKVLVIGAGASGIPAVKECLQAGLEVQCYEATDGLGGLWNYRTYYGEGVSTVMATTVINTSKEIMAFSDYPPPAEAPNFMHHPKLLAYMRGYAEHWGVTKHIKYNTRVTKVSQAEDYAASGAFNVTSECNNNSVVERFDAVLLANGHHAKPYTGQINGLDKFTGEVMHAQAYREPSPFVGKRIVIIGLGNSALDISVDVAKYAKQVYVSTRRGAWIMPRVSHRGVPYDLTLQTRFGWMAIDMFGIPLTSLYTENWVNSRIDHNLYGIKPKHRFLEQHPTLNDLFPNMVSSGQIVIKDDIADMSGRSVTFSNGSTVDDIDIVICCTGYKIVNTFLDQDLLPIGKNNEVDLYQYIYPPDLPHPTLAAIGMFQPFGAVQPVVEIQARWVVQHLLGNLRLPDKTDMKKLIEKKRQDNLNRYPHSPRHTIQLDYVHYSDELTKEIGAFPPLFKTLCTDPWLFVNLMFGPNLPYTYRLTGPNAWPGARQAILDVRQRVSAPFAQNARHEPVAGMDTGLQLMGYNFAFFWLLVALVLNLTLSACGLSYASAYTAAAASAVLLGFAYFALTFRVDLHCFPLSSEPETRLVLANRRRQCLAVGLLAAVAGAFAYLAQ